MTYIQNLYDICKASFSAEGPISEEALEKVRKVLDGLKPVHVGLEREAKLANSWRNYSNGNGKKGLNGTPQNPQIKYMHLHECEKFSIGIFFLSPGALIPLHNHPGMTVLSKVLYGSLTVNSYDWIDLPASYDLSPAEPRPAKLVKDCQMHAPCPSTTLYPRAGGNLHSFKALSPCALFDILSPPYSIEAEDRPCSYFRKTLKKDLPVIKELRRMKPSEVTWLEKMPTPEGFIIVNAGYKGPTINH